MLLCEPCGGWQLGELCGDHAHGLADLQQACLHALLLLVCEHVLVLDHGRDDVGREHEPENGHADDVEHGNEPADGGLRVEVTIADSEAGDGCPPLPIEEALVLDDAEHHTTDDVVDDEKHEHHAGAVHHATHDTCTS